MSNCEYLKRAALLRIGFCRASLLFGVLCHPMYISGAVCASDRIELIDRAIDPAQGIIRL
jgi:hypothetical protein